MMKASIVILAGLLAGACAGEFVDCTFTADADGTEQKYLLDAPTGARDVIVWLHGHGSDRTQVQQERGEATSARAIAAERGMAICSPDYRATASWMGPTAEADMLQLIGILTNSFTGRIFLVGGSMGGTSALTFVARHPSLVAGVTAFNPLADHLSYANFQDAIAASFGGTKDEIPGEYRARSALYFPEAFTMPLAVTLGGADTTIPPTSARALVKAVGLLNPGYVYLDDLATRGHETDYTASLKALREMFRAADRAHPVFTGGTTSTLAHWTFNDDPLGITDASGNYNTLTNNGVPIVDGAASFDGTAKVFCTQRLLPMSTTSAYTIECFMKSAQKLSSSMICELSTNAGGNAGGCFLCYPDGAMSQVDKGGWKWTGRKVSSPLDDGEWHHLAGIYRPNGTNDISGQVLFYIDGVLQPTYDQYQGGGVFLNNFRFYIGSRANSSVPFNGLIDDVRITKGVLTPTQFLKARTVSKPVVAHWSFDTPETALQDASGNGNNLTGGSGVVFTNGYASFNGASHVLQTATQLNLSAYKDVTVEFFIRPHANPAIQMVLELSPNINGHNGCFFSTLNEVGAGALTGTSFLNGWHVDKTQAGMVHAGWHHVAMVRDSATAGDNMWRLYVDGEPQFQDWQSKNSGNCQLGNDILYIGSRAGGSIWLDADLDDIRITAAVLQPGQFLLKRTGSMAPDPVAYWPFDRRCPLADASGNGNDLENEGVTFSKEDAAVFSGAQTKFSTIGMLPLYEYHALTVEFFLRTTQMETSMVLELSPNLLSGQYAGSFSACLNEHWKVSANAEYQDASVVGGTLEAGLQMLINPEAGFNLDWTTGVADGKWHHYAIVYDSEINGEDVVRLYKDGVAQTGKRAGSGSHTSIGTPHPRSQRLYIGSRNNDSLKFVGELDDIRITAAALEPSQFLARRSMPKGLAITLR